MLRRLLLLSALAAFGSEAAYGLGLGKLELDSALNQEFDAEIELTNVRSLETQEILPGLASQEDFERVGIDRNYLLTDLRFEVITNDEGNLAVHITSTRPMVEPYLNFLVEVLWPSGRILREYTVLLDPPVFGEEGVERISAPSRQQPRQEPQREQRETTEREESTPTPQRPSRDSRLTQGSRSDDEYGMTGPGDTLWAIAMDTRPNDSVSVQQMMLAIKRANPEAFINDNINLLKAGHVLRIPGTREIREETFQSAVAKVQVDNDAFEAYRGGQTTAQLDASPRRPSGQRGGQGSSDDGELRLLASDGASGERAGPGGDTAQVERLENELSVAAEDLDRARRANTELNSRLTDLEDQIETLNEIVKLKDDQLAALRAEVERMQSQQGAQPATPTPAPSTPSAGGLLSNPLVLGGLALLVVIVAAGGMIMMRRRRQGDDFDEEEFTAIADDAGVLDEEEESPLDSAEVALQEEEEDVSPQTSDVVSEAEIYIAYGRFPQAISFLQNAMEAEPERADIQLKLLEVYTQTEDATAFNLQLERLKGLGDEEATAQALELQRQIPGAAEGAAASMDATVVSDEPVTPVEESADDDDDMSFDLDDLDSETEDDDSLDLGGDIDIEDDAEELDVDLDLDGDDTATSDDDDSEFDLDLDLEADSTEDTGSDGGDDDDDDDGAISLDDSDDFDDLDLDSDLEQAASSSAGDADADDDDSFELNLDDDDDGVELDLGDDDSSSDDEFELNLDDDSDDSDDSDDGFELNLDDDDGDVDFGSLDDDSGDDDDGIELNLDDDDEEVDLGSLDDESGSDDSDDDELNLDEDASTKLDLARAYIDMGDTDGARNVLEEVVKEGDESEVKEASELLEKI